MGLEQVTNITYKAPAQLQISQATVAYGVAKLLGYEGYVLRFKEQQDWVYEVLDPDLIKNGSIKTESDSVKTRAQARLAEIRRRGEQDSYEIRVLRMPVGIQLTQQSIDQELAQSLRAPAMDELNRIIDGEGDMAWLVSYLTFLAKLKKPE